MTAAHDPDPAKHLRRLGDPVANEYHQLLEATGRAWTTRCAACDETRFPPVSCCPHCGAETDWTELAARGRLHAFTTQESALRFQAPAVLALVELGPVILPAITEATIDDLAIGQEVDVEVRPEPETGVPVLAFHP